MCGILVFLRRRGGGGGGREGEGEGREGEGEGEGEGREGEGDGEGAVVSINGVGEVSSYVLINKFRFSHCDVIQV